ncbi:MAG: galactokinase [Erysipelotrichaceae bacterium]|nr:galactokinase [Erysipelotrichaceae bacterium]
MKTLELINNIRNGSYDQRILDIYTDESRLEYQRKRYISLLQEHLERFGESDVIIVSTPGRSELTGNHTDHQHGQVLACSINLDILAVASKSRKMQIYSSGRFLGKIDSLEYDPKQQGTSVALVKGVLSCLKKNGYAYGNANVVMTSDVLVGSGLSSSAAFEVMIGNIMSHLYNDGMIDQVSIAKYAQYAENEYFGKPSGLMDQCACALGGVAYIDFKDNSNPQIERVSFDLNSYGYSLCIVNTAGSHSNLTGEYASIPSEMKEVASFFGRDFLREVDEQKVLDNIAELRKTCSDRSVLRALHMLEEDKRVVRQLANIKAGDFSGFLQTIRDSGNSSFKYLQNVYVSSEPQNQPISLALELSDIILADKGASRVHGGGFAGTIQAFVRNDILDEYRSRMEQVFGEGSCHIMHINNYGAVRVI